MQKSGILAIALITGILFHAPPVRADIHLFGSRETINTNLSPFPKWTGVLKKDPAHRQKMKTKCARQCLYDQWMTIVDRSRKSGLREKLRSVNRDINRLEYITDIVNWGMQDYWESPYEFFWRNGDCEDYAIAKYMTLKMLGVPTDTMRIVVLQDNNLNLLHSVLVVRDGGVNYILDNQIQTVVRDRDIHHYAPIYSINEGHWWRHLP